MGCGYARPAVSPTERKYIPPVQLTPEEKPVCPKPEGSTAKREVSTDITEEKILSEDDMLVILNEISTACPKWYYIGLQLNVPPHILDGIKSEPTSVHLDKVIRYWLTHRNPRPTWRDLANALRKPTVGESRLAENVERKCCNRKARAVNEINGCKDAAGDLSIDDLGTVLEALYNDRSKWYHLGTQLKVNSGTLESISRDFNDNQERLCQVLKHWLRDTESTSWNNLTVALSSQAKRLPPQPSHKCQPRQKEVEQLHLMFKDLREKNGADRVVTLYIVGLPAFGKTTLASLFAEDYYKQNKKQVFIGFLDATSRATLLESYCTLANETGHTDVVKEVRLLSGSEKELQGLQILLPHVRKELKSQRKWLLVVDNLTSEVKRSQSSHSERSAALPSGRQSDWMVFIPQPGDCSLGDGHVLVTTQDGELVEKANDYVRRHNLKEGMSLSDAVELLESISGLKDPDLAPHVVEALHRIPLSTAAAGYYIQLERVRKEHYGYNEYLDTLKRGVQEQGERLLAKDNQTYSRTLNFALDMCVRHQESNHDLYKVFILMSFCDRTPVPMKVIAHLLGQDPEINSPEMQNVRDCVLLQTSNVKMDEESVEVVSLHETTQQFLSNKLLITATQKPDRTTTAFSTAYDIPTVFQNVTAAFVAQYPHIQQNMVSNVKYYENLQPHLESLRKWALRITLEPVQKFYLYSCLGWSYKISGQSTEAVEAFEHAVEVSHSCSKQTLRQSTEPETATIYLGNLYSSRGQACRAEGILKTVLASLQEKCGENSAEVAHALQGLGLAYDKLRLYDKSLHYYERAIAIRRTINPATSSTAGLKIDIGCLLMRKGDCRQSIAYFKEAIADFQSMPGPSAYANSEIIKAYDYIGNVHILLGELEQGIRARERSLQFTEKLYGSRHRRCVGICTTLSFSYLRLGNFSKSITFAEKAESTLKSHDTFEHGNLTIHLAPVFAIYGQFKAAEDYLPKAVDLLELDGGGTSKIFSPLVAALCGKTADAQKLVQQSLDSRDLQKKIHVHLLLTLFQVQLELGRYTESKDLLPIITGVLDSEEKGEVASDLLPLLTTDLECVWESAGAIHEYLRIIQSFLSPSVPLSEYFNIIHEGFKAFRLKEFCRAEQYFSEALARDKETHGQPNLVSLDTMRMYGTSLFHQDKLPEAVKCLEECLSNARSLCSNHPLVGKIAYTLAQVYLSRGQKELAVPQLMEAMTIFESSYQEHPLMGTIVAQLYSKFMIRS